MVDNTDEPVGLATLPDTFSAPKITRNQKLILLVWFASLVVIMLGVVREFFVAQFGIDTPLQDLRHFSLDSENSLPVWYSSTLMTVSAFLLWVISRNEKIEFRRRFSLWQILAVVFLAMSIDETASFHEVLITPLQNYFGATGIFHFSWVIVAIPALAAFAIYILPDLFRLPRIWLVKFIASGIVYVTGALGMELVGGYFASSVGFQSTSYIVTATIEESLEIIGLTMFVCFLGGYLMQLAPGLTLRSSD